MPNKLHVKKGDTVLVLNGKDRGKKGKVLGVNPDKMTVLVEGINMNTKHKKPKGRTSQGGIIHQESYIHGAKVMLMCKSCGEPTKVGKDLLATGEKVRVCKKCKEQIDVIKKAEK